MRSRASAPPRGAMRKSTGGRAHAPKARAAAVAIGAIVTASCGGGADVRAQPSQRATADAATSCADAVIYWVGKRLADPAETERDYQEMGLSDGQYNVYLDVIRNRGAGAPDSVTARDSARARRLCAERAAEQRPAGSNGRGWPG